MEKKKTTDMPTLDQIKICVTMTILSLHVKHVICECGFTVINILTDLSA